MTGNSIAISIVIPLYNDLHTIGTVLDALQKQNTEISYEVIVVDDGSTDDGPKMVLPPCRLARQENSGPAAARNHGAKIAKGGIVLFLDADCIPPKNWVSEMVKELNQPGYDAVMGTLVAANDGIVPRLVQLDISDRYRSMAMATNGVDFIAAPSCGFRRDVFLEIGGFDERLRQAEDVEIAYRISEKGFRIAFVSTAAVAHTHQVGLGEFIAVKYRRAKGRFRIFEMFPQKRKHDSWTPWSFKLQFAMIVTAVFLMVVGLTITKYALWLSVLALLSAVILGWSLIWTTARRVDDLTGTSLGVLIGIGFVIGRSLVVFAALLATKLSLNRFEAKRRQ